MEGIRQSPELLKPFLDACQVKSGKLVVIAISTFQKFAAHDGLSFESRALVVKALSAVEKLKDDNAALRATQTALTLMQSPDFADDVESSRELLSLVMRIYIATRANPTVLNSAVMTLRQTIALAFDHSIVPAPSAVSSPTSKLQRAESIRHKYGDTLGREEVVEKLLIDLVQMAGGSAPVWLRCPIPPRTLVLDLLESVLLHRATVFVRLAKLTVVLRQNVCGLLKGLLSSALDPQVDPASMLDVKLVVRCVGAVLKRHHMLAADKCAEFIKALISAASPPASPGGRAMPCTPWQRIAVLQTLRQVCTDTMLTYMFFEQFDVAPDIDLNAIADMAEMLARILLLYCKLQDDHEEDLFGSLAIVIVQKAVHGNDMLQQQESSGPNIQGSEVFIAHLALDSLLGIVQAMEALADSVMEVQPLGTASPRVVARLQPKIPASQAVAELARSGEPLRTEIKTDTVRTLVDTLWRRVLPALKGCLARTTAEVLVQPLLKAFSQYTYAAGLLQVELCRDSFLSALCEFTLTADVELAAATAAAAAAGPSEDSRMARNSITSSTPTLLYTTPDLPAREMLTTLSPRNLAALKSLFSLAHRLSDVLGRGWLAVMDVLNCLDRLLVSPYTTAQEQQPREGEEPPPTADWGGSGTAASAASRDLAVLAGAANQLFENTANMSTDAVVALLSALADVSLKSLPQQLPIGGVRLYALNRMVDTLLHNLFRVQHLWGVFLAHMLEALRNPLKEVRGVALDALDRTITGALNPGSTEGEAGPAPSPFGLNMGAYQNPQHLPGGVALETHREDVQNMLLAALDSLYREDREVDVQRGLLKIVVHVLQHHGEGLTRGWVPLLRMLEAVPKSGRDSVVVSLAFQCVEVLVSDFLPCLPKEHIPKTLDVLALFAHQDVILNVSLTAVTMLWNVTDQLARSRGAALQRAATSGVALSSAQSGALQRCNTGLSTASAPPATTPIDTSAPSTPTRSGMPTSPLGSTSTLAQAVAAGQAASAATGGGGGPAPGSMTPSPSQSQIATTSGRQDVSEEESVELLRIAFRSLKTVSMDSRFEVRNSSVRTLFLAVCSNGLKFSDTTWSEVVWDILLPLLRHTHHMSTTSSSEEMAGSELGKEKGGKTVMLLMHHSRNTEQKQWDETLVLALNGLCKVLRAFLSAIARLEGFAKAWGEVMEVVGMVLYTARKGTAAAAAAMLTTLLQAHCGTPSVLQPWMWRNMMGAMDLGVWNMAIANTTAPLQARTELLVAIATLYGSLRDQMSAEDISTVLKWLGRFARYPFGMDDMGTSATAISTQLGPVQKAVAGTLGTLVPLPVPEIWPEVMSTVCSMLCPFKLQPFRLLARKSTGEASNGGTSQGASLSTSPMTGLLYMSTSVGGPEVPGASAPSSAGGTALPTDPVTEARALSPLWMARMCELVAGWYRDHVPWQVRVSTFPVLVSALSECMATRHTDPADELWRAAARAFVAVVQSGLPSINITSQSARQSHSGLSAMHGGAVAAAAGQHGTISSDSWPLLVRAFEMFLLGQNLPNGTSADTSSQQPTAGYAAAAAAAVATAGLAPTSAVSTGGAAAGTAASGSGGSSCSTDAEVQAAVLDCLSDTVLTSCQFAPAEVRLKLIRIIDAGAALPPSPGEETAPAGLRFSHSCLSKLYVLCSRGQDTEPKEQSVRCQLEVAQLALPVFLARCEKILHKYTLDERHFSTAASPISVRGTTSGGGASADVLPGPGIQQQQQQQHAFLADKVLHVLELVVQLKISSAVMEHVLQARPHLKPWVELVKVNRKRRSSSGSFSGGGGDGRPGSGAVQGVSSTGSSFTGSTSGNGAAAVAAAAAAALAAAGVSERKEQSHLVVLYGVLCECVSVRDEGIRERVSQLLLQLGRELGLMDMGRPMPLLPGMEEE